MTSIVLVEDHPALRRLVGSQLEALGHEVACFGRAAEAIAHLGRQPAVSLVIADLSLPGGMNGHELLLWVREHCPGTRVLLLTGQSERQFDSTYPFPVLTKPIAPQELAATIDGLLKSTQCC